MNSIENELIVTCDHALAKFNMLIRHSNKDAFLFLFLSIFHIFICRITKNANEISFSDFN